ncbi:hypothetical protein DFR76_110273 [Nocardia pseudobrasiliensis]|uniref:Type VII secretion system (Wss) protein ESAT-6 n=1 Tax=Nocardia pseudobrasiliensis TaxID=45979 RepID=A0A370HYJ8_9NOCA|nr:hypothetical protein DFR76_110273 [Nocardia pseudobrasiliensis]
MSAVTDNPYPNLGFNPVPGVPEDVATLRGKIDSASEAVKDTNDVLSRLRNGNDSVWKGEGGDAFRSHFDTTLAQDLGYAQHSLERAVTVLDEWHTGLVSDRDAALTLETEAAAARQEHAQAQAALTQAQANPDLNLAHQSFSEGAELQAAQTRLDAAIARVNSATTAVTDAQNKIDSVIKRAHDLEQTHNTLAKKVAAELDSAAKDFAPSPPNKHWWNKIADAVKAVGDWISEHRELVHNILSTVAAVGALVAMFTPPPFDVIGMVVGIAASAANVGLDLTDPKIRNDIGDFAKGIGNGDFLHGDFHTQDLKSLATVGVDGLGMAPGYGAVQGVRSMGKLAAEAAEAGTVAPSLTAVLSDAAHAPGLSTKGINSLFTKAPDSVFGVGAHASPELALMNRLDSIEMVWRGKTAATAGYHDIRDWLKS